MPQEYNIFKIEGIDYDDLPLVWANDFRAAGVRGESPRTVDNYKVRITPTAAATAVTRSYQRVISRQIWVAQWDTMELAMHDHLLELYTSDSLFYIEYPDVMNREYARLESIDKPSERQVFWTPTWPIVPFNYPDESDDELYLHDTKLDTWVKLTGEYNQDGELGQIVLADPIASWVQVYMKYNWRARVLIRELNLHPKYGLAKSSYTGTVVFEQVPLNATYDLTRANQDNLPKSTATNITEPTGGLIQ